MTEHIAPGWAQRIGAAERAVRGEDGSLDALRAHLATLADDQKLLHTADDARQFAYLVTLLRELELAEELAAVLDVAAEWIDAPRVEPQYRCVVHNRLAAALIDEGGSYLGNALTALESALDAADTPVEKAHTHTNLALCAAEQGKWRAAESHARQGNELGRSLPESGPRLDVLLRTTSVLMMSAGRAEDDARVRQLAHDLEELCRQQMDRLGDDHPRSLEALVLMASARHETAALDGDLTGMERLVDVLAVAAQRASTTLGLRHPQARAVRKALVHTHETTVRARAGLAAASRPLAPERHASFGLVLELLVHGIEGATPERTLADPRVVQIAGDEIAALHRRAADVDAEQRPHDYQGRTVPETYSWGPLAPGRPGQVLWFLLLPFMLVNLAHWMRPPARGHSRTIRLHSLLIRLAGLSLTVMVVTAVCELSMDLVAWQCAGQDACARGQSFWLGFLSAESGWWGQPGRRLAVGSLLPCALIWLLWRLSQQTWNAFESQQPLPHPPSETDYEQALRPALSRPGFWYGKRLLARLNSAHSTAGLCTVSVLLVEAPHRYDRQAGGPVALDMCGDLLTALIVNFGLVVVWVVCRRGRSESRIDRRLDPQFTAFHTGSVVLVALCALYAMWSRPGWRSAGLLPSSEFTYSGLLLAQGLIVVALAVAGTVLFRSAPAPRILLRGLAPATTVTLAFSLYNMMAAGAVQGLADWLGNYGRPGTAGGPIAGPPPLVTWQMSAIPVLLAVLLALAVAMRLQLSRTERQLLTSVAADYPGEDHDLLRTRRITTARARARITDSIPMMLSTMATAVLLLSTASLTGAFVTGAPPGGSGTGLPEPLVELSQALKGIGSWLIAVGVIVFLNSSRRASRAPTSRSLLGIVWDVGTFWPRAAHPFARLSYSERAVPDLTWRMSTWCRSTGGRVMVSAHSQGSVLAAAAIWQLPRSERHRVQLLTYGSPLERLYGRLFPAFFGQQELRALHGEVHSWRNLWRATDPIGGRVFPTAQPNGPEVDVQLKDPLTFGRSVEHPLPAPIRGHTDYNADPAFAQEHERMTASAFPERSAPAPRRSPDRT
ncbi:MULTISPECIES: hypothetical protein [unclassified Streptomyces]|uniref:hypothetical protein n=1 Tax=unclassified Streptomyces TaxID=2593676 RepID=UPI00236595F8|nr:MULTISPECIES: hypothetical protein [unclassified Streptomyces]MDF3144204.1 hypothetical protein [Streptomyces sp. T21Q-yed]WDF43657.1 hypothetical protein PBV52_46215 [Streptomyces sp. T12]